METVGLRASVVIPVFNRSHELRMLLSCLVDQTISSAGYEILICDDGSAEDIPSVLKEFQSPDGPAIRYYQQPNQGPGAARNLGLNHAKGAVVAFTDTDCIPESDWLEEIIRPIEHFDVVLTGGIVDYQKAQFLSGRCSNFLMSSMLGAGGARDPRSIIHMEYYPRTGNSAVDRLSALEAGGFPSVRHGEDLEFASRIKKRGGKIIFVPSAIVTHNEKKSIKQLIRESFLKGCSRIRLAKTQGAHQMIHSVPAMLCLYWILLIVLAPVFPAWTPWLILPAVVYSLGLLILSIQAVISMKTPLAMLVVPFQAAVMHFSYGFGYISQYVAPIVYSRRVSSVTSEASSNSPS